MNRQQPRVALKKLSAQLWYVIGELVAFAFFGGDVDTSKNRAVAETLSNVGEM